MQVQIFAHAQKSLINDWLKANIGKENEFGQPTQIKFITQSSAGVTHGEGDFLVEEITICIWYE